MLAKGSEVRRGQTIARLDSDEWVVGARVEARKLAVETAKRTLKEQETLFSRQLATEMDVESARRAWADAEANYKDALIKIDKTRLLAPIQGVMSELADITQGTLVTPNTAIAKIMDYSQVFVDLKIPNAQIINVKLGQGIRVSNYALPEEVFEGEIVEMDPAIDPVTRTVQVVGMVDNPDLLVAGGHVCQNRNCHGVAAKCRTDCAQSRFAAAESEGRFCRRRRPRTTTRSRNRPGRPRSRGNCDWP